METGNHLQEATDQTNPDADLIEAGKFTELTEAQLVAEILDCLEGDKANWR